MVVKKRQVLMATLVIALGSAVFINWYFTRPEAEPVNQTPTVQAGQTVEERENLGDAQYVNSNTKETKENGKNEFFASAKLRRSTAHDEAKESLNAVIQNTKANTEAIKEANNTLTALTKAIKMEADMENLISAKIGSECVVIYNGNVEVIVGKGVLNDQIALQIKEIVMKQSSLPAGQITLVELNT